MSADLQNLDSAPSAEHQASTSIPAIVSKSDIEFRMSEHPHFTSLPEKLKIPAPEFFDCGDGEIDVLRFISKTGSRHDVLYIDSPSTEVIVKSPEFVVINRHHALLGDGDTPLEATVLGGLARAWLEHHGIAFDHRRKISLRELECRDASSDAPGVRAIGLLRAMGEANNAQLHDLYSNCWSTRQSPRYEQTRRLEFILSTDSERLARKRLGNCADDDVRSLADEVFMKTIETSLGRTGEARLPRALISDLALLQRERLESEADCEQLNACFTSALRGAIAQVQAALGEKGLEDQRDSYASLQWSLELLFSRQPGSRVPAPR